MCDAPSQGRMLKHIRDGKYGIYAICRQDVFAEIDCCDERGITKSSFLFPFLSAKNPNTLSSVALFPDDGSNMVLICLFIIVWYCWLRHLYVFFRVFTLSLCR
jgi:hypothetical protein